MESSSSCPLLSPRRTPEPGMPSSPTYRTTAHPDNNGSSGGRRPKKLPTVTPRRFNRFFAPRNAQQTPQSTRTTRTALGDISYSGGNRQPISSPIKQSRKLLDHGEDGISIGSTPEKSSPLKRVCLTHPNERSREAPAFLSQDFPSSPPPVPETPKKVLPKMVKRTAFRKAFANAARRETAEVVVSNKSQDSGQQSTMWQAETSHFYSRSCDQHITWSCEAGGQYKRAIPFSVAACHSNPVIAVSDEEGYVRLIESKKDSYPSFDKSILELNVHHNAILGLEFSEDDMTLVTASGDQTARVIDVQKQEELFTLCGHSSSLRQARFQPGSGGKIIATAGRDGRVFLWDLRCVPRSFSQHPYARPRTQHHGPVDRDFAEWVQSFMPPVLVPLHAQRRHSTFDNIEQSVTAMSFLDAAHPHMVMTGSATSSGICLWDLRQMRHNSCQNAMVNSAWPNSDRKSSRGVVKMTLSGDNSRLYALCKDSTLYSYSMAQLLCKGEPVNALYGFKNPALQVTTFYSGLSVRPGKLTGKSELIAVTGGSHGPVVIPSDESYLDLYGGVVRGAENRQGVKIYEHGSVLKHGHRADLCDVVFTNEGNLVSIGDDSRCRVWYESRKVAADMRDRAKTPGEDLRGCAWSEPTLRYDQSYLSDGEEY